VALNRRRLLFTSAATPLLAVLTARLARAQQRDVTWLKAGITRQGGVVSEVFGFAPDVAAEVLLRATKPDALPDGYTPTDLVSAAGNGLQTVNRQVVRALIVPDTSALLEAAAQDGVSLYVGSGFRSQEYQTAVFAAQVARWGDAEVANRYSARPGHSQHQLGTTIDFTTDFRTFRGSDAPLWLGQNAHRFGFVLPYTAASTDRTGYIDEPWHGRWLGQPLAGRLQAAGYQEWTDLTVDDVVALVRSEAALDG
jgi:D-alanyl-D-alanine carboxypeptidase